jgi:hypothetical protein
MPEWRSTARGGIVGIARLLTVIPPVHVQQSMNVDRYPADLEFGWHMQDQWGFVLTEVRPLPFRPLRGELGFFEVT